MEMIRDCLTPEALDQFQKLMRPPSASQVRAAELSERIRRERDALAEAEERAAFARRCPTEKPLV